MQRLEVVGDGCGEVRHANGADVPTGPSHVDRIRKQSGVADHLERMVDTAAAQLLHGVDHVEIVFGQDEISGAELGGELLLFRNAVDGDDLTCSDQLRGLDNVETDAPGADHDTGVAQLYLGTVEDCAGAGHHATADEGRTGQRHLLRDGDALVLGDDGFLYEGADVGEVEERLVTFGVGLREATHADGTVARVADLAVGAVAAVTER